MKLVNNWIHSNTDDGIQFDADLGLSGVVTINGNLLKENGGNGINNLSTTVTVPASLQLVGRCRRAGRGDGVNGLVTDYPVHLRRGVRGRDTGHGRDGRNVNELDTFDVAVKVDAKGLYAVQYKLTYDPAYLTLQDSDRVKPGVQVADGAFKGSGSCTQSVTVGTVTRVLHVLCAGRGCGRRVDGEHLTFKADGASRTGNGPWTTYLDLSVAGSELSSAARDGVKVYVNNGGFDAPSTTAGRTITDTPDDGKIIIDGLANYTGYVDLQGRANDSGAVFEAHNQALKTVATVYANGTTASSGKYTTAYVSRGSW